MYNKMEDEVVVGLEVDGYSKLYYKVGNFLKLIIKDIKYSFKNIF
jgi:hypothetical protein